MAKDCVFWQGKCVGVCPQGQLATHETKALDALHRGYFCPHVSRETMRLQPRQPQGPHACFDLIVPEYEKEPEVLWIAVGDIPWSSEPHWLTCDKCDPTDGGITLLLHRFSAPMLRWNWS